MTGARYSIDDLPAEIRSRIVVNDLTGCWEWQFTRRSDTPDWLRYAALKLHGTQEKVHRITYGLLVEPAPDELQLDHVYARGCRAHSCCNPAHLEPVTEAENKWRGGQANVRKGVARSVQLRIARGRMTARDHDLAEAVWMLPLPAPAKPVREVAAPRTMRALYLTDEAAEMPGVTVRELIDWRQEGRGPICFLAGKNWLYGYDRLMAFKAELAADPAA